MSRYRIVDDRPSPSDLYEGPVVDEDLVEPASVEEEEMAPADPAAYEPPTERQVAWLQALYARFSQVLVA